MSAARPLDLAVLASLLDRPLRVEEAAEALGLSPQDVLDGAREAVDQGVLVAGAAGYTAGQPPEGADAPYIAFLAGKLAETLAARGAHAEAGSLYAKAGRISDAVTSLTKAALDDGDEEAAEEAFELDEDLGALSRDDAGRLHLMLARIGRNKGDSNSADARARDALRRLEGSELVDALGYAAAIASDLQESQRAETYTVLGAGLALTLGRPDKGGSLLTLQGRELARLGFADEADTVLAHGIALLEAHADRGQRFRGRVNAGWVAFDRGLISEAEVTFDELADQAEDLDEPVTLASQMAYHSRALAIAGRITQAADRAAEARAIATEYGARAIEFLVALGEVEGALAFRRPDDAVAAAAAVTAITREHVPSWLNRSLHYQARAALLAGDRGSAQELLSEARGLTPDGIDGWRVRNIIRVTELEIHEGEWPQREAEDLTDEFLQARQYLSAAELLTIRAVREKDPELGLQAAALARQIGAPAHAALAIEAAGAWNDATVAAPAGEMMRRAAANMPDDWREGLRDVPAFAHALDAEVPEAVDTGALDDLLTDVLTSAGLAGEVVLSPAQRRARGLVRRKPRRRRTSPTTWIAAAAAVVALAVATVALLQQPEDPVIITAPTTVPRATTTTLPPLEATSCDLPELGLFGSAEFRGGSGLTGVVVEGGVSSICGTYWVEKPGGFFQSDPIAAGRLLYIGSSTNDIVYQIDLNTGKAIETLDAGGRVLVAPAVGDLRPARGDQPVKTLIYISDGVVYGQSVEGAGNWNQSLGSAVGAGPVIAGDVAIVVTEDGRVVGFNADGIEWTAPPEDAEPFASISEEPAVDDGIVHVVDDLGDLHLIDASTGEVLCSGTFRQPPIGNPVVSDGVLYVQSESTVVYAEAGTCGGVPSQITMDPGASNAIAVSDGVVFSAEDNRLFPIDPALYTIDIIGSDALLGPWNPFIADSDITTPPVIANGLVYFGTQGGIVHAIDLETGDEVWSFDVGLVPRVDDIVSIQGSPVVLKNTVIVTTNGGHIVAIATADPE